MRVMLAAAGLLALATVAGCERGDICSPMLTEKLAATPLKGLETQPAQKQAFERRRYMDYCVQKWGYVLGPGNVVDASSAEAVMGACGDALNQLNLAEAMEARAEKDLTISNFSESTGAEVSLEQDNFEHYRRLAFFYLAQGHAGHCRVPR